MNKLKLIVVICLSYSIQSCNQIDSLDNSSPEVSLSTEMKNCIMNPECQSSDGRLIIGYKLPQDWDSPHYRGPIVMEAVYEGDTEAYPIYK